MNESGLGNKFGQQRLQIFVPLLKQIGCHTSAASLFEVSAQGFQNDFTKVVHLFELGFDEYNDRVELLQGQRQVQVFGVNVEEALFGEQGRETVPEVRRLKLGHLFDKAFVDDFLIQTQLVRFKCLTQ